MCSRADSRLWFSVPLSARSLPLPVILSPLCSLRHEKKQICRDACGLFCQLKRVESLERVPQSWDNKNVFFSSSLSYLDNFISCCKRGEKSQTHLESNNAQHLVQINLFAFFVCSVAIKHSCFVCLVHPVWLVSCSGEQVKAHSGSLLSLIAARPFI